MRGMSMTTRGITVAGNPDVIIGTKLGDGTWVKAGTTSDGQPIFTQQIAAEDTALRAYIVGNTMHGEIPGLITYGATYVAPFYSNTPLPMPTASCATAECAAGVLPNRPLTQPEIDVMRNGAADFAGSVSAQAGRFSTASAAAAQFPSPYSPAFSSVAFASMIASWAADGIEHLFRPDPGTYITENFIDLSLDGISRKYPLFGPVVTEIGEAAKTTTPVKNAEDKLNNVIGGNK